MDSRISFTAFSPFCNERQRRCTVAFRLANATAVAKPMPPFAPVIRTEMFVKSRFSQSSSSFFFPSAPPSFAAVKAFCATFFSNPSRVYCEYPWIPNASERKYDVMVVSARLLLRENAPPQFPKRPVAPKASFSFNYKIYPSVQKAETNPKRRERRDVRSLASFDRNRAR